MKRKKKEVEEFTAQWAYIPSSTDRKGSNRNREVSIEDNSITADVGTVCCIRSILTTHPELKEENCDDAGLFSEDYLHDKTLAYATAAVFMMMMC